MWEVDIDLWAPAPSPGLRFHRHRSMLRQPPSAAASHAFFCGAPWLSETAWKQRAMSRGAADENSPALQRRVCVAEDQSPVGTTEPSYNFSMRVVNLTQKLSSFSDFWSPKIAGELNDSYVKLVKMTGEFLWHNHEHEDELFLVLKGVLRMKLRDNGAEREEIVREGEFIIVPRGVEHTPIADHEVHVMLLEPKSTLNTGNVRNERTREQLGRI
jgi:mannose-6-phosphate isomerase-like protein (cupin superfamily)